jgi:P27 family predicted phage terminase small subunit
VSGSRGPLSNVRSLPGVEQPPSKQPKGKPLRFDPKAPTPPGNLCAEAKAEWKRVVPQLDAKGLLATVDRGVLSDYCDVHAKLYRLRAQLDDEDLTPEKRADNGPAKNPAWQMYREATTLKLALAKELLLTPSARLRAQLPEADDAEEGSGILD